MLTLPFDESVVMPESQMCRKFSRESDDQKQIKNPESFSKQIILRGKNIKRSPGEDTEKEEEEEEREEEDENGLPRRRGLRKKRRARSGWKGSNSGDKKPTRVRGTGCTALTTLWTI